MVAYIGDYLTSKGLDIEIVRGMLKNQDDAVRKEAERLVLEAAESAWHQVEGSIAIVNEILNAEFTSTKIEFLTIDMVLKNLTLNVSTC